jgi:hypothetical protein
MINQKNFKYKYHKYKYKYLWLKNIMLKYKQSGGEVLSTINQQKFQNIFYLDLTQAYSLEFINGTNKYNDVNAYEFIYNYYIFLDNLDNLKNQNDSDDSDDSDNFDDSDDSYNEYRQENSDIQDYLNLLQEINIETWNFNIEENPQYFLVKLENDEKSYLLKILSGENKYEFIKNMKDYDAEYGKLKKMDNLLSPQYLFEYNKDNKKTMCGYIMKYRENFISLDTYFFNNIDKIDERIFLEIIKEICNCCINIFRSGLSPCIKNNQVLIYNQNFEVKSESNIKILLSGIDALIDCRSDIEEESIRDIAKIINPNYLSRELKNSYTFKKIFKIHNNMDENGISLNNSITTIKSLLNLIEQINVSINNNHVNYDSTNK